MSEEKEDDDLRKTLAYVACLHDNMGQLGSLAPLNCAACYCGQGHDADPYCS